MPVERQWVDLNSRVFYPIKESLRRMEAEEEFSIDAPLQKNAVSTVSRMLVEVGLNRYITCHNHQIVQGKQPAYRNHFKGFGIDQLHMRACHPLISSQGLLTFFQFLEILIFDFGIVETPQRTNKIGYKSDFYRLEAKTNLLEANGI